MESEMFIVQKMLIFLAILCIDLKTVTGKICYYYPNATTKYDIECKFVCCNGYPKTINTTCCDINDYVILSWVLPFSIIFVTAGGLICLFGFLCHKSASNSVRPISPNRPPTVHPIIPNQSPLRPSVSNSSLNLPTYGELNNITDELPGYERVMNRQL